ncbi:restriction endonuclease subunit S [Gemmiger formicilis]|uniref:restriction endonuclease subunit S n=1 Tax=Gemmiger formicilis TaxID=745368 RepID=UPI003991596A
MREMKDSGIEWIGEIPLGWEISPLKYNYTIIAGATPNSTCQEYWDGNITWITPADYKTPDVYVCDSSRKITKRGLVSCSTSILPVGSIVFSKRAPIGSVAITRRELCTNQGCIGLVAKNRLVNNKYFYYVLSIYPEVFDLYGSGTTFKEISATTFASIQFPFPHVSIQDRIATFLDSKCSEIDAISADIQKEIETLEQYKRSVITEAVTKGLNPDVEMKDSGIEWVGNVPDHWGVLANKYVMKKRKDICTKWNGENVLSLTMNGVIVRDLDNPVGKMPTTFDGYQFVYSGNLLMCLFDYDVTPRCVGIVKNAGVTSPAYSRFELKENATLEYFYYYYLMIDFTKELLHLAKNLRHSFTEEQLGALKVPLPPLDEQKNIATYLDSKCKEIESVIASKKQQLEVLDSYKKSLIYEYVTGKKEVPNEQ